MDGKSSASRHSVRRASEQQAADGELYAINVRPDWWGVGAGRALLAAVNAGLAEFGYRRAVPWVMPGNHLLGDTLDADVASRWMTTGCG